MPFIGTTPTQGFVSSFPKQSFTPNGSTTVFTLTNPVANENDLEVFVANVRQEPGSGKAYTAAGTTLTMSEAPASGVNFYVINKSFAQVTTTPPVNSISTDKILNSAVTDAKIGGMAASKLTGALPAIDGGSLTGAVGGKVLLLDQAFGSSVGAGSVTSYDISSTYVNSTYDSYFLEGYFRPSSDGKYLYMRVMVGGSVQTGNIYANESHIIGGAYSSGGENNNTTGQIAFQTSGSGNGEGEGISINIFMSNINSTIAPFHVTGMNVYANTSASMVSTVMSGSLLVANKADVVNGLSFLMHSGNIHGGNVRLYGLRT